MTEKTKSMKSRCDPKGIGELWFSSQLMKAHRRVNAIVDCPAYKMVETRLNPFGLQQIKLWVYENDLKWTLISPRCSINESFHFLCGHVHEVLYFYRQLIKAY